jgi:hypothetical protein
VQIQVQETEARQDLERKKKSLNSKAQFEFEVKCRERDACNVTIVAILSRVSDTDTVRSSFPAGDCEHYSLPCHVLGDVSIESATAKTPARRFSERVTHVNLWSWKSRLISSLVRPGLTL